MRVPTTTALRPTLLHTGILLSAIVLAAVAVLRAQPALAALAALCLADVARRGPNGFALQRLATKASGTQVETTLEVAGTGALPDALMVRCAGIAGLPRTLVLAPKPTERGWVRQVEVTERCHRTGPIECFRADVRVQGARGGFGPLKLDAKRILLPPPATPLPTLPPARHLVGAWGPKEANRAGQGTRLFDVAQMRSGDRMANVSWRATARNATGVDVTSLYVARAHAGAEAVVMVAVDRRDDLGQKADAWAGGEKRPIDALTSLDLVRNAALSIATAHLGAGDRVGLIDLADPAGGMRPGAGKRSAQRIARYLTIISAPHQAQPPRRHPRLAAGAAVWLISSLLDQVPIELALTWARAGHQVQVVDALPPAITATDANVRAALQLTFAERETNLARLAEAGIPVFGWHHLDAVDACQWVATCRRAAGRSRRG